MIRSSPIILRPVQPVFLTVWYYRPDFRHLLQEFSWQTDDQAPDLPRVHQFLDYWRLNIEAVIHSIEVSY